MSRSGNVKPGEGAHSAEVKHFLNGFQKNVGALSLLTLQLQFPCLGVVYIHLHGGVSLLDENVILVTSLLSWQL